MKAVILAGGFGTRLSEETGSRPKPMVEIGAKPMLWHIMNIYSAHGINDFIICCGYKGYVIKEYFANYFLHMSDVTIDLGNNGKVSVHEQSAEPWRITLVDTGENTMTGGRIKRIKRYLDADEDFCMTYGDGLSDVDITDLIKFHKSKRRLATLTAVQLPGRFGALGVENGIINSFQEKPSQEGSLVNGGFFVLSPKVLDYIDGDETVWERKPMETLAQEKQLAAYNHSGFWQPMDTLRDKHTLEALWQKGDAPWMKSTGK